MAYTLDDYWITETLRLRESLWGPLEDASETGTARTQGGGFVARLMLRARLLGRREGLDQTLLRWRQAARLTFLLFGLLAVMAGCLAAASALGTGGAVNLAVAVGALLGLNTLAFALWLLSFIVPTSHRAGLLADAWLRITRKLARGPDAALLPRALLELFARQRVSRWAAGVLSHAVWALAMLAGLSTLFALLATRRYTFQWETTLLSPDTFVLVAEGLGYLPSLLGFPQPTPDMIKGSSGLQALPESAHALWSAWLLGLVITYGLLPRVAALLVSMFVTARRLKGLTIDPSLPGFAELEDRLMPASIATGLDSPAPASMPAPALAEPGTVPTHGRFCLMGLELPPDLPWPPDNLPGPAADLGVIDTRDERRRVLELLRHAPALRLVVCCDARQTPDRGTVALLRELATLTHALRLVLLPDDDTPARRAQWCEQLVHAGFTTDQLPVSVAVALDWLSERKASE